MEIDGVEVGAAGEERLQPVVSGIKAGGVVQDLLIDKRMAGLRQWVSNFTVVV